MTCSDVTVNCCWGVLSSWDVHKKMEGNSGQTFCITYNLNDSQITYNNLQFLLYRILSHVASSVYYSYAICCIWLEVVTRNSRPLTRGEKKQKVPPSIQRVTSIQRGLLTARTVNKVASTYRHSRVQSLTRTIQLTVLRRKINITYHEYMVLCFFCFFFPPFIFLSFFRNAQRSP